MSPHLEVFVPRDQLKNFQAGVSKLEGVEVLNSSVSDRDAPREDTQTTLARLKEQVATLTAEVDPETSKRTVSGYKEMLIDAYLPMPPMGVGAIFRMKTDEEIVAAKKAASEVFLRWAEEGPESEGALSPQEVTVLIQNFGLADGVPRSTQEISESLQVSKTTVGKLINKAISKLRRYPENGEKFATVIEFIY